jgi:aconitate hydratase
MGVLPLQFQAGESSASLALSGREEYSVTGVADGLRPGALVTVVAREDTGRTIEFKAVVRIDTPEELVAFKHGGILPYVLRQLVGKPGQA